jgi:cytochrome c556
MKQSADVKSLLRTALVSATAVCGMVAANAQSASDEKPMALRAVMEKLGQDMQKVTLAIAKEDWPTITQLAAQIANHAEPPPTEKVQIIQWLGTEAPRFRGFDGQSHQAATDMAKAASQGDGQGVIAAFAKVQQSCLGCHQAFRRDYLRQFYKKP